MTGKAVIIELLVGSQLNIRLLYQMSWNGCRTSLMLKLVLKHLLHEI